MSENPETPPKCAMQTKPQISELEMMMLEKANRLDTWLNDLIYSFYKNKTDMEAIYKIVIILKKVRDDYESVKASCLMEMQRKGEKQTIKDLIIRIDGALMQIRITQDQYQKIQMG